MNRSTAVSRSSGADCRGPCPTKIGPSRDPSRAPARRQRGAPRRRSSVAREEGRAIRRNDRREKSPSPRPPRSQRSPRSPRSPRPEASRSQSRDRRTRRHQSPARRSIRQRSPHRPASRHQSPAAHSSRPSKRQRLHSPRRRGRSPGRSRQRVQSPVRLNASGHHGRRGGYGRGGAAPRAPSAMERVLQRLDGVEEAIHRTKAESSSRPARPPAPAVPLAALLPHDPEGSLVRPGRPLPAGAGFVGAGGGDPWSPFVPPRPVPPPRDLAVSSRRARATAMLPLKKEVPTATVAHLWALAESLQSLEQILLESHGSMSLTPPSTFSQLPRARCHAAASTLFAGPLDVADRARNARNLARNALSDSIPSELSTLTKLTYLDLRQNQLTGTFPESLSELTKLQELWLENNQLTQSLPSAIGNLANLRNIDLSHNYFTGGLVKPANVLAVLSYNYLSGTLPAKPTDLLDSNCFKLAAGETEPVQRTQSACRAFCGISMGSAAGGCSGHGVLCYPDGPNLVPTCVCEAGFYTFRRTYCLAEESVLAAPLEKAILPPSTVLTAGLKAEAKGLFTTERVPLFVYQNGQQDPGCGFELAFSVNFTFVLSPKANAASNGFAFVVSAINTVGTNVGVGFGGMDNRSMAIEFDVLQNKPHGSTRRKPYTAWVDYVPGDPGTIQVFLATTAVKPAKPLLDRRLSLCAVLQPGPPQGEGMPEQPRAFYFGFVASTTVKPFMIQAITSSYLRTDAPPARGPVNITPAYGLDVSLNTFVPAKASPFPRYVSADYRVSAGHKDSWVFRDLHSWDAVPFLGWPVKDQKDCNACWAYAVVSSIEAAYGIALNQEAPVISVDSLFTAMNLTTQAAKCTAGGSPTEAFEKLMALPKGAITMEGNTGFERTAFKGYVGLMLAVQRQPVVVHVEALAASFAKYDGTFKYQDPACYTGNLNHVVLVIGYLVLRNDGSENRIAPPFWIIRNSWGEAWGDRGHMRIDMQGGDGVCGINVLPGIYPIVKIPGDPCGLKSYKGDGDLQPSMNPCVDVCGSYFKNPCAVGTCINDGKGSYSCICPLNYVNSTTIDSFPTCDPANTTAANLVVTGDNWLCSDIYPLVGLTLSQHTVIGLPEGCEVLGKSVVCTKALPKGRRLRIVDTPAIPCTAYFYALSGDTCLSIAKSLRTTVNDLMNLNPGLDCTQTIKAGRSICVERNETYAYTVPECVKYTILTADDTCEKMLQGQGLQNDPSIWAELYRNNPGLLCSNVVPASASAVGSNAGVQVCLKAEYWPFELGKCTKGRPKNVSPSLSCSAAYSYYGGTMTQAAADFNTYNGNACAKNVGSKFICVPR
ncbi:unnamed protein product [Closterium sp. Yama58-4]|nr:unnamed protein product [Closterium sp. Yama58-4]